MDETLRESMGGIVTLLARVRLGISLDPRKPAADSSREEKRRWRKLWRMALARILKDNSRNHYHFLSFLSSNSLKWALRMISEHGVGCKPDKEQRYARSSTVEGSDEMRRAMRAVARELGLIVTEDQRRAEAREERRRVRASSRRRKRRRRARRRR